MQAEQLHRFLEAGVQYGASDVHFRPGVPPLFRVHKRLVPAKSDALTPEDTKRIASVILRAYRREDDVDRVREFDASYAVPGVARFRVNIYRQRQAFSLVLRIVPDKVPTIDDLGLPKVIRNIADTERGLILVTGTTGSGKSTTIAAMLDHINDTRSTHIITVEDPIEYLHRDRRSSISQREVGIDTESFVTGLRAALRQDPDVIVVGEMRDKESIEIAIKATETGHAVYSTLHTTDAAKTIGRILGSFSAEEQKNVRLRLAESLQAVVSQRLLPRADNKGVVVAAEIMVCSAAVRDAIRDPGTANIQDLIANGKDPYGMHTFDQHLLELYREGLITKETGLQAATIPADFERDLLYT